MAPRWASLLGLSALLAAPALAAPKATPADLEGVSIHTVFSAECTPYFDWQSLGLVRSHRLAGMPGPITRLLACDEAVLKNYKYVDIVPTHVHPNFNTLHLSDIGDNYVPYNKPGSIKHWLEHANVTEEYVFFIDADMLFLEPFTPKMVGVKPGRAVSAAYDYLIGLDKEEVVSRFIPKEHWPLMRKVGGWTMMLTDDMRRVAPLWLKYTEDVRTAPFGREVWFKMGDAYVTEENPRPWISEMYGYSFGAAHAGVDHLVNREMMLYPTYTPDETPPYLLHYGLEVKIGPDYVFDKHFFTGGDHLTCPVGLFDAPPNITQLMATLYPAGGPNPPVRERERLDLAAFTVNSLNEALKEYGAGAGGCGACDPDCVDTREACGAWAKSGECAANPSFMNPTCKLSCKLCTCSPASPGGAGRAQTLRGGEVAARAQPSSSPAEGAAERVRPRVAAEKHANTAVREAALKARAAAAKAEAEEAEEGGEDEAEEAQELEGGDLLRRQAEIESAEEEEAEEEGAGLAAAARARKVRKARQAALMARKAQLRADGASSLEEGRSLLELAAPLGLPLAFLLLLSRLYSRRRGGKKAAAVAAGSATSSRYED